MDLETSKGLKQKRPIEEHPCTCTVGQWCTDTGREDEVSPERWRTRLETDPWVSPTSKRYADITEGKADKHDVPAMEEGGAKEEWHSS